jgi:hypothetical protein
VEISEDEENNWNLVADQTQTASTAKEHTDSMPNNPPGGRFVRVTFDGTPKPKPLHWLKVEISGNLATQ